MPIRGVIYRLIANPIRTLIYLIVLAALFTLVRAILAPVSPWGPVLTAKLPDGGTVAVRSRLIGNESEEQLIWTDSQLRVMGEYSFNGYHAGPYSVQIRFDSKHMGVWVESGHEVIALLNLKTREFDGDPLGTKLPDWVKPGSGESLASGAIQAWWQPVIFW